MVPDQAEVLAAVVCPSNMEEIAVFADNEIGIREMDGAKESGVKVRHSSGTIRMNNLLT